MSTAPVFATEAAQVDYMNHCQGCHLPDGSGFPARGVPDMRNVLIPLAQHDEGRGYLVQVPGSSLSSLSDEELAPLINWLLGNLGVGGGEFAPYTTTEITHWRAIVLENPGATRERLLAEIEAANP